MERFFMGIGSGEAATEKIYKIEMHRFVKTSILDDFRDRPITSLGSVSMIVGGVLATLNPEFGFTLTGTGWNWYFGSYRRNNC